MVLCFCSYTIIFLLVFMELMISGPHLVTLVWLLELLVINGVLDLIPVRLQCSGLYTLTVTTIPRA